MTRDSDTRRMAETGTGSVRSTGSAVPNGQSPNSNVIPSDLDTLVEFQNEAARYFESCPVGDEDRAHWANVYNAENCRKTATAITSLRNQLAEAKAVITEANNSLYGSQGFFLSTDGGAPDKYHLARPIEDLKARSNKLYNQLTASEARECELRAALEEVTDLAGSLLWKAEDDPCIKRAHRLTNTENHHDR